MNEVWYNMYIDVKSLLAPNPKRQSEIRRAASRSFTVVTPDSKDYQRLYIANR